MSDQADNNAPQDNDETPLDVVIPDSPEGLFTPRLYRKQAQQSMMLALKGSLGRSGLTEAQKMTQLVVMRDHLVAAVEAANAALDLMAPAE